MINIAICIDNNFIMQAGVFIKSILETNTSPITIYVLSEELSNESQKKLNNIIQDSSISLSFKKIDLSILPKLPLEGKNHITAATYYRLLLPFVLPIEIDKILYLDCDMIVLNSLKQFYDTDISDFSCATTIDMFNDDIRICKRLKYSETAGYFNAGMLLINLNNWRKNKISEKAIDFIGKFPELCEAHDQDALNHAINGDYLKVSAKYNMQLDFFCDHKYLIVKESYYNDIEESQKNPVVIHFTGPTKPWLKNCNHPYTIIWDYFLSQTEWKNLNKKYEYKNYKLYKYFLKHFLISLHLYKEKKSFLPETYIQAKEILEKLKK